MSPDNPTQILTAHDLTSLRTLQRVITTTTTSNNNNHNNTAIDDHIVYNSHVHNNNNSSSSRNHNYNLNHNSNNINTNGANNHHTNTNNNNNSSSNGGNASAGNLVFSTIPLDGHALLIQPSHLLPANAAASLTSNGLQQAAQARGLSTTATNGLRAANNINSNNINTVTSSISPAVSNAASFISSSNSNSNNSLNNFLAKATILSAANFSNAKPSGKIFNTGTTTFGATGGTNMPTTSKYVLLQPNGNGQFTTYEGSTPAAAAAAAANGNAGAPSVGNIVLLATEPMDLNGSSGLGGDAAALGRVIATAAATGTGDNDEELRPLAWLNDSNLIKGIVTTTAAGAGGANVKRAGGGNICIVSASNAHELIEELPHHVGSEEVTTTTPSGNMSTHIAGVGGGIGSGNGNTNNNITSSTELKAGTQITALSVSDFQQLKRYGNIITTGTPITLLPPHDPTAGAGGRKDEAAHIYGNIGAISATTTVHMGPSGTTTVVEYKSNGNMPTLQSRQLLSAAGVGNASGGTTITPANFNSNGINNNANSSSSNNLNSSNYVPSSFSSTTSTHSTVSSTPASIAASNPASMSVSYSTAASTTMSVAGANSGATVLSLPKQLTTLPGGVVTVTNGNGTTSTIYQGQQQQQNQQQSQQKQQNYVNNNTHASSSASSTTHHPHKKYLREKMNVLDHGGGGGGGSGGGGSSAINASTMGNTNGGGNASASTITVVASPASSSCSLSSSVSSSSSTAAVNGGNSPVSKSFYAGATNNSHNNSSVSGGGSNGSSSGAINYSSTANTSPPMVQSNATAGAANANSAAGSPIAAGIPPTYTIMQYQSVASSPSISSPEPNNSKEFYPLITPQQQQQRNTMRSPTSYSSYDNDSLKDFEISTNGSSGVGHHNSSTPQHQTHQSAQAQQQLSSSGSSASSKNSLSGSMTNVGGVGGASNGSGAVTPQKQKHPNNVPYDPFVHTHNKPPYSFSSLIFMAIEGSNEKALPVKEIYAWIMQHFPYFKTAPAGWKNSVRHNLSLNKSFVKVEKAPNMGKGSLWRVEPQQRQNLIQALNRSPFFPNSAVDKSSSLKSPGGGSNIGAANDSLVGYDTVDSVGSGGGGACSPAPKSNINPRIDPRLFPKLSKVIGGQGLLNDVVVSGAGDVPDEDTPSDYSTTNHNSNLNNHTSSNNKHSSYNSSPVQQNSVGGGGGVAGGNSGVVGSGASILGPFSSYESIERLARDCGADSIDDVNAATAMLALKHGPKVFSETFQNGAPVITSSPSEDHTYSAGGGGGAGGGNSGSSTPLTNGSSAPATMNGNVQYDTNNGPQPINGCNGDNQSNYTSSDAAYESSEDNNNITPEELEDQRRQREGVDALLSLSRSSVVESPTKRPSSTSVEEEHISACLESNKTHHNNVHFTNGNGKMALLTSAVAYSQQQQQQQHHAYEDSGSFHLPSYYGGPNQMHDHHSFGAGGAVQRKIKPLRSLRTKIKRKAPWMSKAR